MLVQLQIMLAMQILAAVLAPKPVDPPASALSDFNIPTPEQGRAIKAVFGKVKIDNAAVVWSGNFTTTPIKSKSGKKG